MLLENGNSDRVRRLTLAAMLFAMAMVLSVIENMLPPIPLMVPGVKLGLSNIVVMYALFFQGKGTAFTIAVLKAFFTLLSRGAVAGALSLGGGICSVFVMAALLWVFKDRVSYFVLSVMGAVFHNVGQFAIISFIYTGMYLWFYLPVLLVFGVIAGAVTAVFLKWILPVFKKMGF